MHEAFEPETKRLAAAEGGYDPKKTDCCSNCSRWTPNGMSRYSPLCLGSLRHQPPKTAEDKLVRFNELTPCRENVSLKLQHNQKPEQ